MRLFSAFTHRYLLSVLSLAGASFSLSTTSIPVGTVPGRIAVNQTTNRIYVTNLNSNNVSVIDGESDTVIATVPVGMSPSDVGINSVTNLVYVASSLANSVSVIDGTSNTVVATIPGLKDPLRLSVNAVTNEVFVANSGSNSVSVIDGSSNTIVATIPVGSEPAGVRANSATNLIYVANLNSGTISVIDGQSDTVTNTFTLPQPANPGNVALDPITNELLVTDGFNSKVYVINASSGALLGTITGSGKLPFAPPTGIVEFQLGRSALVSFSSINGLMLISDSSYTILAGLKSGNGPVGIAVNRTTGKVYVTQINDGTVIVYTGLFGMKSVTPPGKDRAPGPR
ncbi:MAG TPA: hypothetical protein VHW45_19775 [Candidatus Sulfotelmatobacter sp.]|nr:hypothetical protein [Candidatus Sulfotelmatobacter sp.]